MSSPLSWAAVRVPAAAVSPEEAVGGQKGEREEKEEEEGEEQEEEQEEEQQEEQQEEGGKRSQDAFFLPPHPLRLVSPSPKTLLLGRRSVPASVISEAKP
jgi:hypothetical protein